MMIEASIVNLAELAVLVVGVVVALRQLDDLKHTREMELARACGSSKLTL